MTMRAAIAIIALAMPMAAGCRHTWQGAKADTRHAVQKTEHAVDKTEDKVERDTEKKK